MSRPMFRLEVYRDWRGMFGWRLVNERGYILATSGERYPTREVARSAARGIKPAFAAAQPADADRAETEL